MDKKRTVLSNDDSIAESPSKKHKKHKKKHKKKGREELRNEDSEDDDIDSKPIKLKIKFGNFSGKEKDVKAPAESAGNKSKDHKSKKDKAVDVSKAWKAKEDVFRTKRSDEDTSDEEKEWLDALEKGTLDDKGDVKRQKDIKLMTARQRALIHGIKEEPLMQLPTGNDKPTELSEEQVLKRKQKAKHRREMAAKKQEKDKKQTLARLLTKQDAKAKGVIAHKEKTSRRTKFPGFRYIENQNEISIFIPEGAEFPFAKQVAPAPPPVKLCEVVGCQNAKKYTCSKTGVALCSLQCYKQNLSLKEL